MVTGSTDSLLYLFPVSLRFEFYRDELKEALAGKETMEKLTLPPYYVFNSYG